MTGDEVSCGVPHLTVFVEMATADESGGEFASQPAGLRNPPYVGGEF